MLIWYCLVLKELLSFNKYSMVISIKYSKQTLITIYTKKGCTTIQFRTITISTIQILGKNYKS